MSITFLGSLYDVTEKPGSVQKIPHPVFCQADLSIFPKNLPEAALHSIFVPGPMPPADPKLPPAIRFFCLLFSGFETRLA
ncbi:MAG: hypothetical protein PHD87_07315 [Candidatus Cloacimonetes bacterium]|nr:hypothetical protein [Candidatus Cloacimonadota bacterium]